MLSEIRVGQTTASGRVSGQWVTMAIPTDRLRQLRGESVPEPVVYTLLSNERRRTTLAELRTERKTISVRELSERIATAETGEDPAPRNVRESVYVSLHQTHLPTLDDHGLVEYDRDRKVVHPKNRVRAIRPYVHLQTRFGVTWTGVYQWLGILGLFLMVASLGGVPGIAAVPPLLLGSAFLGAYAVVSIYRVWRLRRRAPTV